MEAGFTYHASANEYSQQSMSAAIAAATGMSSPGDQRSQRRSRQLSPGRVGHRSTSSYSPPLEDSFFPDAPLYKQLSFISESLLSMVPVRAYHLMSLRYDKECDAQLVERLRQELLQASTQGIDASQSNTGSAKPPRLEPGNIIFHGSAGGAGGPGSGSNSGFDAYAVYAGDNAVPGGPQDSLATEAVRCTLAALLNRNGFTSAANFVLQQTREPQESV